MVSTAIVDVCWGLIRGRFGSLRTTNSKSVEELVQESRVGDVCVQGSRIDATMIFEWVTTIEIEYPVCRVR